MVGGTPLMREIVWKYGADRYTDGAGTAVQEAVRLLEMRDEMREKQLT